MQGHLTNRYTNHLLKTYLIYDISARPRPFFWGLRYFGYQYMGVLHDLFTMSMFIGTSHSHSK